MKQTNRRNFLGRGVATAAAAAAVAAPAAAQTEKANKRVLYKDGKKPAPSAKTPLFNSTVAYGNLLFIAGVGAHVPGDIKSHTKIVLDSIQQQLGVVGVRGGGTRPCVGRPDAWDRVCCGTAPHPKPVRGGVWIGRPRALAPRQ